MNNTIKKSFEWPSLGSCGQFIAIAGSLLYVLGFLVVNAYYVKLGVQGAGLVRPQYLLAGVTLAIPMALYLFMAASAIYNVHDELNARLDAGAGKSLFLLWGFFACVDTAVDIGFRLILAASWSGAILFGFHTVGQVYLWLSIYFLIDYPLLQWTSRRGLNRGILIFRFIMNGGATVVFFLLVTFQPVRNFFWFFVGLSVLINLILDLHEKTDRQTYLRTWDLVVLTIVFLGFSIYFGAEYYPLIRRGIGGGRPTPARIAVSEPARQPLAAALDVGLGSDSLIAVQLLAETAEELVVTSHGAARGKHWPVRIPKKDVILITGSDSVPDNPKQTHDDRASPSRLKAAPSADRPPGPAVPAPGL